MNQAFVFNFNEAFARWVKLLFVARAWCWMVDAQGQEGLARESMNMAHCRMIAAGKILGIPTDHAVLQSVSKYVDSLGVFTGSDAKMFSCPDPAAEDITFIYSQIFPNGVSVIS